MHTDPLPSDTGPEQPAKPSLLEEMAALTGLFNPEVIWHEEEVLDKLDEQAAQEAADAAATSTSTPPASEPS
jgi:hypothetical protein